MAYLLLTNITGGLYKAFGAFFEIRVHEIALFRNACTKLANHGKVSSPSSSALNDNEFDPELQHMLAALHLALKSTK